MRTFNILQQDKIVLENSYVKTPTTLENNKAGLRNSVIVGFPHENLPYFQWKFSLQLGQQMEKKNKEREKERRKRKEDTEKETKKESKWVTGL